MNQINSNKKHLLWEAFRKGMSLRAAAQVAGVSKVTAMRYQQMWGGRPRFESLGASFKDNRFR